MINKIKPSQSDVHPLNPQSSILNPFQDLKGIERLFTHSIHHRINIMVMIQCKNLLIVIAKRFIPSILNPQSSILKLIFSLLLWLAASISFAASAGDQLLHALSEFQTMTANFSQVIENAEGVKLQEATGVISISRPGKFRWEIQKPNQQIIVANGKKVWIYDPDLQQVIIRKLNQSIGQTPVILLTHSQVSLDQDFDIEALPAKSDDATFQLTPKNKEETFSKIILSFHESNIHKMVLLNQLGQKTQIIFSDIKINQAMDESPFNFKVPHGVDAVNE